MPALPAVPNVVRVAHEGTIDTYPWAGISHWRYVTSSGPLTSTQLEAALAKFVNSWRDNIRPALADSVIDSQVVGIDLTSSTAAVAVALDGDAGGHTEPIISPEACLLVTKPVGRRYRGGHPRTYWPGLSSYYVTTDHGRSVDAATFAAIQARFATYYTDIPPAVTTDGDTNCSSWHEVSVSYHGGGVLRTVPLVDDILSYNVHQVLATQRRRQHRG